MRHVENLIASWSAEPAPVLRTGGLGVRELRKVAKDLDVDERRAALLIELVVGADLVANTEAAEPEWVPTTKADVWLAATAEVRWATIAHAWLELPRLPALVGRRDEKDKLFNPLGDEIRRAQAPRDRRWILETLGALPKGTAIADPADLAALLAWRAPRRGGRQRDELVRWTVEEGTAVGVLALGSITTAGRVLLDEGPGHAAKALARRVARAARPRAGAGRPDRRRARPARTGAGGRARGRGERRVRGQRHRLPDQRGHGPPRARLRSDGR